MQTGVPEKTRDFRQSVDLYSFHMNNIEKTLLRVYPDTLMLMASDLTTAIIHIYHSG